MLLGFKGYLHISLFQWCGQQHTWDGSMGANDPGRWMGGAAKSLLFAWRSGVVLPLHPGAVCWSAQFKSGGEGGGEPPAVDQSQLLQKPFPAACPFQAASGMQPWQRTALMLTAQPTLAQFCSAWRVTGFSEGGILERAELSGAAIEPLPAFFPLPLFFPPLLKRVSFFASWGRFGRLSPGCKKSRSVTGCGHHIERTLNHCCFWLFSQRNSSWGWRWVTFSRPLQRVVKACWKWTDQLCEPQRWFVIYWGSSYVSGIKRSNLDK